MPTTAPPCQPVIIKAKGSQFGDAEEPPAAPGPEVSNPCYRSRVLHLPLERVESYRIQKQKYACGQRSVPNSLFRQFWQPCADLCLASRRMARLLKKISHDGQHVCTQLLQVQHDFKIFSLFCKSSCSSPAHLLDISTKRSRSCRRILLTEHVRVHDWTCPSVSLAALQIAATLAGSLHLSTACYQGVICIIYHF